MKHLNELGEKLIISEIIKPLFNPTGNLYSIGDDCAIIETESNQVICLSTDRVPHDLIAYKIGLIANEELGYYLATLNISDIVASGGIPEALLLNLAFPNDFPIQDFKEILNGIKRCADDYNVKIIGGDLSSCPVINLSATSIGKCEKSKLFHRKGSKVGDLIFCTNYLGLTSTSFNYFLNAKPKGLSLSKEEEVILIDQFKKPKAYLEESMILHNYFTSITAMDNTDGIGQSFLEMSQINKNGYLLRHDKIPIHDITHKVAEYLRKDVLDIALGPGADFQLIGTVDSNNLPNMDDNRIIIIGEIVNGDGVYIRLENDEVNKCKISGWNYYDTYGS